MRNWWIGCSGFYYRHWRGGFYPEDLPMKKWFEYYCQFFNTVELNVTFYRFPKLEALRGWRERSPYDFRFTVKAPRLITHYKKFKDAKKETRDFYDIVHQGLSDKLGTVLFQLHPRFLYSEENLERLIETLDPAFRNVLEFRHVSWWNDTVLKTLRENNITFCSISYPSLPDTVFRTSPVMYYRFHGVPNLYRSPYTLEKMSGIVEAIKRFRSIDDVYIYFNNDIDVSAIRNAREIQGLVGYRKKRLVLSH
jgi:uncharacterized protein YecE (DUF72 family)